VYGGHKIHAGGVAGGYTMDNTALFFQAICSVCHEKLLILKIWCSFIADSIEDHYLYISSINDTTLYGHLHHSSLNVTEETPL